MDQEPLRTIWMAVMLGILIATAPTWINRESKASYDAPWMYSSHQQQMH